MLRKISHLSSSTLQSQVENTKTLINLIQKYQESLGSSPILKSPGSSNLSSTLPMNPVPFSQVIQEVESKILPNNIDWGHPMFFAFFPLTISWSSIQGEILAKSLQNVSFTKQISPVSYDIEMIVADWFSEMLGLPSFFYNKNGPGGGITYSTASDAVLTAMACARLETGPDAVAYVSDQAHFSIEKAARVLNVPIRVIPSYFNEKFGTYSIDTNKLRECIVRDKAQGLKPSFIVGCIGGTNVCSIDENDVLGDIAHENNAWFHIDAAYAGSFCILPEFKYLLKGVEKSTTFNINSSKMLMAGMNSSHMWVKDKALLVRNLAQSANYLKGTNDIDLKNWQIPLGRDCKALKTWFIIQEFGVNGIYEHLRKFIEATEVAEQYVKEDDRLEMVVKRILSLLVFRVKGNNDKTEHLIHKLAQDENIFLLGSKLYDRNIIRLTPGSTVEGHQNIHKAFSILKSYLD